MNRPTKQIHKPPYLLIKTTELGVKKVFVFLLIKTTELGVKKVFVFPRMRCWTPPRMHKKCALERRRLSFPLINIFACVSSSGVAKPLAKKKEKRNTRELLPSYENNSAYTIWSTTNDPSILSPHIVRSDRWISVSLFWFLRASSRKAYLKHKMGVQPFYWIREMYFAPGTFGAGIR